MVRGIAVREVMSTPVAVIDADASIREAAKKMNELGIGSLVVVKDGEIVGIVTERDLVRAIAEGADLDAPVSTIMSEEVYAVAPETSVLKALEMMRMHGVRHLPVVNENDELLGIVSLRDLAFAVAAEMVMKRLLEMLREELEEI
ncbi:hypothetical protein IPA_08410 [Ignicoccus pacificus DSM 13166]|uniref:CBS domain-containing protein n=1 Tax=Ignicoccus pacificus DSM 13166 TaxID=940294 RepID=A0A977PJL6_9CREN|nr:hypothetical protein IPA_08410 [Ignicoccus pacificus DSM 13166]